MRRIFSIFLLLLLLFDVNGYTVSVNSNRKFLFGDVLEPLCSIDTNGEVLSKSDVVQLFHAWENLTSSQIATSSKISEYRKAMPCFPGPSLEIPISNEDLLPPYPNCPTFVNISTATIEEVEDLIQEIQKQKTVQQMDISLKSVANSLSNRLQNLVDFLPEGETKRKVEVYHSQLLQMSTHEQDNSTTPPIAENYNTPQSYSNPPSYSTPSSYSNPSKSRKFSPLQLLSCFNISMDSLGLLKSLSSQTIGSIGCSKFQICSFSDFSENWCLSHLNITENQYNSVIGETIGEVLKDNMSPEKLFGALFGRISRFRRTPEPDYEEVTLPANSEDVRRIMEKRGDKIEKILEGISEEGEKEGSAYPEDVRNSKFRGNDDSGDVTGSGAAPEDATLSGNFKNLEFGRLKDSKDVISTKILKNPEINRRGGSGDVTPSGNFKNPKFDKNKNSEGSGELLEDVKLSETLKTAKSRRNEDSEDVTDSGEVVEDVTLSGNLRKLDFRKLEDSEVVTASGNSKISNNDEKNDVKVSEEALEDVTPSENLKTPKSRRNDNSEDVPGSGETAEEVTPSRSSKNPKIEKREDSEEVDFPRSSETPKLKGNDDSEDVTSSREPPEDVTPSETPKTTNSKNCGTSGNLVTVDGVTIFNCEDSEDVTNPSIQNLEISKFLSEINETVLEDSSKNHFDEALNFFKSHVTFSESDDDVIQNLLNSTLNSTILEYGASFLNESSDLRRIILDILPHLPQEFTVGQLLEKLGIQNLASVSESLITFLGSIKETSGNSNSSKSPELVKIVQKLSASDSTSKSELVSDFLEKNPTILANFGF